MLKVNTFLELKIAALCRKIDRPTKIKSKDLQSTSIFVQFESVSVKFEAV